MANVVKNTASINTPAIGTSAGDIIAANDSRQAWGVQNLGTNVLFVRMGTGASSSLFHVALAPGLASDDGLGDFVTESEGVVYTGIVSVAGTSPRYTYFEH